MKRILLLGSAICMAICVEAQIMRTTVKIVNGKARVAVKAEGGNISGSPSNFIFTLAVPIANAALEMTDPTRLDVAGNRNMPTTLSPIVSFDDGSFKYFNLFYSAAPGNSFTYNDGVEVELFEINFSGNAQSGYVSLFALEDGAPAAPDRQGLWLNYLEVGGGQYSFGDMLFYQSSTSQMPQVGGMQPDYSGGTSFLSSNVFALPVSFLNFSGYKSAGKNILNWTTASEQNNTGFEVQRSLDGVNYAAIGFVNTKAPAGNSSTELTYTFNDNSPLAAKKTYYRLRQVDMDSRSKLSDIVVINGERPALMAIASVFPNPASSTINVIIDAPRRDNITLLLTDISGKTLKQKTVNVETGSNTVPVEISQLAKGNYFIKVLSQSQDGETAVSKFIKQ